MKYPRDMLICFSLINSSFLPFLLFSPFSPSLYGLDKPTRMQIHKLAASNPNQLSEKEYMYLAEEIERLAPCNVLVFGLGNDSVLWDQINAQDTTKGKTIFLEHNPIWYKKILSKHPHLNCYFVEYHTTLSEWESLLDGNPLSLQWISLVK